MDNKSKSLALLLILTMIIPCISLMMVKPANAQALPQPIAPHFTLKFVDSSYFEAPVYSPNPYTGQNDLIQASNYELNLTVEMTINNQPFTPYIDAKGNQIVLLYDVQWKPHYSKEWNGFGANNSLVASNSLFAGPMNNTLLNPKAPTTIYYFGLGQNNATAPFTTGPDYGRGNLGVIPLNGQGQVDFKIEAFIGYGTTLETNPLSDPYHRTYEYYALITGPSSGFSDIQTITIPATSASPSPTPTVPEFPILAIMPLFAVILLVSNKLLHRKQLSKRK